MGWFDKVLKYGTVPGWLGMFNGGGSSGSMTNEESAYWAQQMKQNEWGQYVSGEDWGNQYGGSFEDWFDLYTRSGKGPPGQPAQSWQEAGTADWLARSYYNDPLSFQLMQNAGEAASRDYTTMAKGSARRGADVQSRELSNALASRGGGNLGAAMAGGATMRSQAELGGLQTGLGMEQQANDQLLNALSYKFNILNQITAAKLGQTQAHLGYKAAKESSENQMYGQMIGGAAGGLGSLFGPALGP